MRVSRNLSSVLGMSRSMYSGRLAAVRVLGRSIALLAVMAFGEYCHGNVSCCVTRRVPMATIDLFHALAPSSEAILAGLNALEERHPGILSKHAKQALTESIGQTELRVHLLIGLLVLGVDAPCAAEARRVIGPAVNDIIAYYMSFIGIFSNPSPYIERSPIGILSHLFADIIMLVPPCNKQM